MTNLKVRASYGYSGNNAIGNYTWIPTLSTNNYTFDGSVANGKKADGIENTELGWERSKEFDAGFDLILFSGRLSFIFEYYNKVTEDMLWPVSVPISSGFSSVMSNIGEIGNNGVEFTISSTNIAKKDFTWNTDFNISFNKNEVLDLGEVGRIQTGPRGYSLTVVGEPMGMFYGYQVIGMLNTQEDVDNYATAPGQLPGTHRFLDNDGNGIIDTRDKVILGNPHPDFRGGFNNTVNYKNWDLNVGMSFAHNFDIWSQ